MSQPSSQLPRPTRRTLFAGAAAAGAAAAVAGLAPAVRAPEPSAAEPRPVPEKGGGYSLTEHVKHYYRTTRL